MRNTYIKEMIDVWKRQKRNWKIIAIRQVFNRFFNEIVRSYSNIYITLLGASPVDLGIVNSFTGISNALISVPLGWFQDRYSIRKIFIMGIGLLAIVPIIYATASSWQIINSGIYNISFWWNECKWFEAYFLDTIYSKFHYVPFYSHSTQRNRKTTTS